jgi:hypothetical protein
MLAGWADSQLFKFFKSIFYNGGMESSAVNQAYNSIIGLVKYLKMYGDG